MATLADELLNDFEEDDGHEDEEQNDNLRQGDGVNSTSVVSRSRVNGNVREDAGMELDDDEEAVEDDEELMNGGSFNKAIEDAEDADDAKQRVEKMQLGGVNDVRSVAVLMKSLEPVLEVSSAINTFLFFPPNKQFTLNVKWQP